MRYKGDRFPALATAPIFESPKPVAFQVVARARGDKRDGWGVILIDPKDDTSGVGIRLSRDGRLTFEGSYKAVQKFPGQRPEPVRHAAIKTGDDDNTLLIVLRGRELEVYVNGVAVCQPVQLDREFAPIRLLLAAYAQQKGATGEFKQVTIWRADGLPTPEERTKK